MAAKEKLEAYFEKSGPFKEGIGKLRRIALECGLEESLKWNAPVYTMEGKNVVGILSFKNHYALWFYNGVFHSDPLGVLQNAQEGKTRALRHWKFKIDDALNPGAVKKYIEEAIQIEKKGLKIPVKKTVVREIPAELKAILLANPALSGEFYNLPPYKQNDYCEYIATAKRDETRERRLQKIIPMISKGIGLNDRYQK
jgi:uncharacterized protein YdeI (YjbR/CyaY-like superfamily)